MDFSSLSSKVVETAVKIQQIPAPTFSESDRARYIQERFKEMGIKEVSIDGLGNVFARLPGTGEKPALVVTAHSDTVFPVSTDLSLRREANKIYGPGIGDNALGVAGLFGLVWAMQLKFQAETKSGGNLTHEIPHLPGDLWLVVNVGEEGLGDLCGMKAVVNRFGEDVLAYIVLEGMALGQVYHRALGVQRYRISVSTPGGHSWVDYGQPSAVNELSHLINRLADLPLSKSPRSTLNVGVISGGTSINTIAANAYLELDLRSESANSLQELVDQVEGIVTGAGRSKVRITSELIGQRPAGSISTNHPLIRLVTRTLVEQGIKPILSVGSTDANIPLSRGLPAVCLGLSSGSGAHTTSEYINTQPIEKGLAQLVSVVEGVFREF